MVDERPRPPRSAREVAATAFEVVLATAIATGLVAALQSDAPPAGLGAIYLLAVMAMAIRRGELAALATAVLGVLALNYLFIPPRHQFAIAHSQDLIELIVFLIAAVVVGRLAAAGRQRAAEAESRARIAAAREREATLLAEAASAILAGRSLQAQLDSIGARVADATGASRARVTVESVPSPRDGEVVFKLVANARVWLYVADDVTWVESEIERIAEPLGRLIDVAVERQRIAEQAAETEAAKRAETARTAILHAISHDLRSPLTAITTAASALRAAAITDDERDELIDAIDSQGLRLAKLVDDLLDLGKIQAGAVLPRADWCDLSDVVASAAAHLGHRPSDRVRAPGRPAARPRRRVAARARVLKSARERDQVLARPVARTGQRRGVVGAGHDPRHRPWAGDPDPVPRARVRAVLPRPAAIRDRARGWGSRSAAGSSRPTAAGSCCRPGADGGTSFAVSFPVAPQPAPAPR